MFFPGTERPRCGSLALIFPGLTAAVDYHYFLNELTSRRCLTVGLFNISSKYELKYECWNYIRAQLMLLALPQPTTPSLLTALM